ncbi:altronate hydrolase [Rhodanobacter fulvus Jip2]|uniref:Altronate hydrolase n=1 Tax=Rhodanobacter fulvus Jip2 TaxID=1163408 RepID=I4VLC1_9GAMM|nr:altronate dehydratase family protein [Rhodanobacter fulvus]EIL88012.1 altronate hydrolase [Rhodanobacter fulvus Jip2]
MPSDRSAPLTALQVHAEDEVAIALTDLAEGTVVSLATGDVRLRQAVPHGHKFAVRALAAGQPVHKYGFAIGRTTAAVAAGDWVHTHNMVTGLSGTLEYRYQPLAPAPAPDAGAGATFQGYRRADGRVGTRNEIWVLCTVGCVARTARRIAEQAERHFGGRVDGVHAFTHPFGCSQLGSDLEHTRQMLAALARHPNAGGVLLVGLGCESLQMKWLLEAMDGVDPARLRWFNSQLADDEVEQGLAAVEELVAVAEQDRRQPCDLSDLVVGLKCGGSDGFSGITANPVVGRIADRVAAAGGTPILTEIPEIFGAERMLMARAQSREVFEQIGTLVNDFKRYFLDHGQPVHENPSPGNLAGGITTLEEKSLGAVQKGGRATVTQVLRYGQRAQSPGLALLEAPGNDAVSATALTAAGATVILFTTGRGTPLGFPVPTLKIATNSALAAAKPRWIDFDAGALLDGLGMEALADALQQLVLDTASGKPARNEINDEREIALWKTGVTL